MYTFVIIIKETHPVGQLKSHLSHRAVRASEHLFFVQGFLQTTEPQMPDASLREAASAVLDAPPTLSSPHTVLSIQRVLPKKTAIETRVLPFSIRHLSGVSSSAAKTDWPIRRRFGALKFWREGLFPPCSCSCPSVVIANCSSW